MTNEYYTPSGNPVTDASGLSSLVRAEFSLIEDMGDKMPVLASNGSKMLAVNSGETGLEAVTGATALTNMGITATLTELNYVDGVTSAIQAQLDALGVLIGVGASTITPTDSKFIVGNGSTFVGESGATARASLGVTKMSSVRDTGTDGTVYCVIQDTSNYDTYFGYTCGDSSDGGSFRQNSGFGNKTLTALVNGTKNSGFGYSALKAATSASSNTGIGNNALFGITTQSYNTVVGSDSGAGSGLQACTFIGALSAFSITSATNCVALGYSTSPANNATNAISIGYNVSGTLSNTVAIGNSSIVDTILQGVISQPLARNTIADTGTVTVAEHRDSVLYQDASGGNVTMTTATGSALDAEFDSLVTGQAIKQYLASNHATNTSTISGGTGVTLVGSGSVTQTGGQFLLIKTGTATYDLVRVG